MKNDSIKSVIVLCSICLVVALSLSSVNTITAPIIEEAKSNAANEAYFTVLPNATDFETLSGEFPDSVLEAKKDIGGSGYAFKLTASSSFSKSPIEMVVGIGADGKITDISFINYAETKGTAGEFQALYKGKDSSTSDMLAGATYSSAAIKGAIDDAYTLLAQLGAVEPGSAQKLAAIYDKIMPNTKDKTGAYNFSPADLPESTDSRITAAYTPSNNIGYIITAKVQETELAIGINAFGKAFCVFDLDGNELTDDEAYTEIKAVAQSALEPVYKKSEKRNLRSLGSLFSDSAVFEAVIPDTANSTLSAVYKVTDGGEEKYALIAQPIGFGGVIKLCVVMTKDGQISDFKVLSHTESAYYGDKIATEQYSNNIKDKKLDSLSDSDLQVSSATITSEAVKVAIKDIKEAFAVIKEGF